VMSFLKNPHYLRQLNSIRKLAFYAQGLSQKLISQLRPDLSQLIFVVVTQRL